ncbi:MAG: hypothetical protein AB1796_05605 [Bacillota bacterium]
MNKQRFIVDKKGNRTAVIVPIKEYNALLEDLHDFAVVAERRDEPVIDLQKLKENLITDGLL